MKGELVPQGSPQTEGGKLIIRVVEALERIANALEQVAGDASISVTIDQLADVVRFK